MPSDQARESEQGTTPRFSSPGSIFALEVFYLLALGVFVVFYRLHWIEPRGDFFGPVPFLVPWFGAVGAALVSLSAVFDKRGGFWDVNFRFWHWSRPLVGAIVAAISVLILQSGILAVGGQTPSNAADTGTAQNLLYYVIAFLVGYRERVFRQLMEQLADVVLTPPSAAPGAPRNVKATARNEEAEIVFDPPAKDGGAAVMTYTATASNGSKSVSAVGSSSPIVVTGLTNGTTYAVTVHGENAVGVGPESSPPVSVTPTTPKAPGAPREVQATGRPGAAEVSFVAPEDDGGAEILRYTVTAQGGAEPVTETTESSPFVVENLASGTTYTFTVRAENSVGPGAESEPSNELTIPA